nr:fructosamine kinase [Actinomycetales bacterium]
MHTFRKHGSPAAIATEATSLRWLAEAVPDGGAPVVPLLTTGGGWLETEYLAAGRPSAADAEEFGRRLAVTHAAGAGWWGAPPPGLEARDSRLAELDQPVFASPAEAPGTWGEFYAEHRVRPYVRMGADAAELSGRQVEVVERALARIGLGEFDVPQPVGCPPVARVHGDLWGGNVLWAAAGDGSGGAGPDGGADGAGRSGGGRGGVSGVVGTLIDPAAHGGHAETDLAELALFGSPHLEQTRAGYDEVAPLADVWRERVALHQMHMLAVHVALFGGGYGAQLAAAAARYT